MAPVALLGILGRALFGVDKNRPMEALQFVLEREVQSFPNETARYIALFIPVVLGRLLQFVQWACLKIG